MSPLRYISTAPGGSDQHLIFIAADCFFAAHDPKTCGACGTSGPRWTLIAFWAHWAWWALIAFGSFFARRSRLPLRSWWAPAAVVPSRVMNSRRLTRSPRRRERKQLARGADRALLQS